jgi:hypothetical protein
VVINKLSFVLFHDTELTTCCNVLVPSLLSTVYTSKRNEVMTVNNETV